MRLIHLLVGALVTTHFLASSAAAGDLEDAEAAYRRQDYATALRLLKLFADQGDAAAQTNIGRMYKQGYGVPHNNPEAVKWFRKAADQGFAPAQFNLGNMYEHGWGVPQDYVSAHMWLNLAAAEGDAIAKIAEEERNGLQIRMAPEQIAEAQRLAREWKPTK